MPNMWDAESSGTKLLGLRKAVEESLRLDGARVFSSAYRFLSFMEDLTGGESDEMALLRHGLDDEALVPFQKVLGNPAPTATDLQRASRLAYAHLVNVKKQQEGLSRSATEDIGWGIADWYGVVMPPQTPKNQDAGFPISPLQDGPQGRQEPQYRHEQHQTEQVSTGGYPGPQTTPQPVATGRPVPPRRGISARHVMAALAVVVGLAAALGIFFVTRPHTIAFDGNGATSGSMESLTARAGETIVLPLVAYEKEGFQFDGWRVNGSANDVVSDGGSVSVPLFGGVTLEASWVAQGGLADSVEWETLVKRRQDEAGMYDWVLRFTNASSVSLDMTITNNVLNANDGVVATSSEQSFYGIAPGESNIMIVQTADSSAQKVTSSIRVMPSDYPSLKQTLEVSGVSQKSDGMVVDVTNRGSATAEAVALVVFGQKDDEFCYYVQAIDGKLKPGATVSVQVAGVPDWDLSAFSYYFYGRAS